MIRFSSGDLRLSILDAGTFWLDGGAMFGVVPKPIWEKLRRPDERNRIEMGLNVLLVEDGKRRILVDTGAGTKGDARFREIHRLDARTPDEIVGPAGLTPDRIDVVVNTHLHFDHAGGNTTRDASGRLASAWPNARFVVQKGEIEFARIPNERLRAAYPPDNFEPLSVEGRFDLVEGDASLDRHVKVRLAPGHTPHHHVVVVETGEHTLCFLADLVPMTSHVPYPYIMGYDLDPLATLASKKRLLPEAYAKGWRLVFEHDHTTPLGVLRERDGKLGAVPFEPEA